jgi:hypothetical protein
MSTNVKNELPSIYINDLLELLGEELSELNENQDVTLPVIFKAGEALAKSELFKNSGFAGMVMNPNEDSNQDVAEGTVLHCVIDCSRYTIVALDQKDADLKA